MINLTRAEFERVVQNALDDLPDEFRQHLHNVLIMVENYPGQEAAQFRGSHLLGLYVGVPRTKKSFWQPFEYPPAIYLYQHNIEQICRTEAEVEQQIRDTLLHEIGHHFGMDEEQLRTIEAERDRKRRRRRRPPVGL
jgi:predicted Zn-dependent protease with MMP-like domain